MKKKIILSILSIFMIFGFAVNVSAAQSSILKLGFKTEVKSPTEIPADGATVYAAITDQFDFSRVVFQTGSSSSLNGGIMRKIIIAPSPAWTSTTANAGTAALGTNWFSAYCLDNDLLYPEYGVYSSQSYLVGYTTNNKNMKFDAAVTAALMNSSLMQNDAVKAALAAHKGFTINPVISNPPQGYTVGIELANTEAEIDKILANIECTSTNPLDCVDLTGQESTDPKKTNTNTAKIQSITFTPPVDDTTSEPFVITAAMLTGNPSATEYNLQFKAFDATTMSSDIAHMKYKTDISKASDYPEALWIIEHSYPTLPLREALEKAGVNYDTLASQIIALQKTDTNSSIVTALVTAGLMEDQKQTDDLTGDELTAYIENYVYATVQYAIWKVQGATDSNGNTIGSSIQNVSELNKLFQYLINVPNLSGYTSSDKYSNTISLSKPAQGKEVYEEKNDVYIYGPYTASYDALSTDPISLSVGNTGTDKDNIRILNASNQVINSITNGGTFYVEVKKSAKLASVIINAKVNNVTTFSPGTNRARVYSPNYVLAQNVMSGGIVNTINLDQNFSLDYNAKTGVENVAMLLMVTLVAFSLGYMVLSYKAKPIGLN